MGDSQSIGSGVSDGDVGWADSGVAAVGSDGVAWPTRSRDAHTAANVALTATTASHRFTNTRCEALTWRNAELQAAASPNHLDRVRCGARAAIPPPTHLKLHRLLRAVLPGDRCSDSDCCFTCRCVAVTLSRRCTRRCLVPSSVPRNQLHGVSSGRTIWTGNLRPPCSAARNVTGWTPGDDLRHLRRHRTDPAARDQPGHLGDPYRVEGVKSLFS